MTKSDRIALEYLIAEDSKFYIIVIDNLQRGTAKTISADENGILLSLTDNERTFILIPKTENKAAEFAEIIKERTNCDYDEVIMHTDIGMDKVAGILNSQWCDVPCYVAARFSLEPFDILKGVEFRRLDHSFDEFVAKTYTMTKDDPNGIVFASNRIDAGMYGLFENGKMAGFIGTHPEGTMGMLEILPEFRRKGYGRALEEYLANKYIEQGRYPYCNILETNTASLSLQRSMGFWLSEDKRVYWLK